MGIIIPRDIYSTPKGVVYMPRDDLAMLYIILYLNCEVNFGPWDRSLQQGSMSSFVETFIPESVTRMFYIELRHF